MTLFNALLIAVILVGWFYAAFSGQGLQPFEITWAIPVFGLAFGEICRAVADIADDKSRGECDAVRPRVCGGITRVIP